VTSRVPLAVSVAVSVCGFSVLVAAVVGVWWYRRRWRRVRRLPVIPYADLKVAPRALGEGNFGKVYKATWRTSKAPFVAVKENGEWCTDDAAISMERRLLGSIPPHPNVVRVYGVCIDAPDRNVCIVMELAECSLESFLREPPAGVVR
jgi:hypothetical protein